MKVKNPDGKPDPEAPPTIAAPTEAEVRAADLERDDAARDALARRRQARIRQAAYDKYERRGSVPGREEEDWLEAEREIDEAGDDQEEEGRSGRT